MLFPTLQFAVFFCVVLAVHRLLGPRRRVGWLLFASLFFYFLWLPPFLLLLLGEIGVTYGLLRGMTRSARPRVWLVASIVFTMGVLAVFKYAAFVVGNVSTLTRVLWGTELPLPDLLLPLGISFYSFQIVALSVDVFRGRLAAPERLTQYALFISFFPQLIAGPIVRGNELLPQLEAQAPPNVERDRRGVWLLGSGLFKKVVLGDFLLAPTVDAVFAAPGVADSWVHVVAVYSFAFQIYFDFSGYTDMARGLACLLGYELPRNFEEPYLSRNPAEFWRRWHMTLSRWLRDYVYIPLGGNRSGSTQTARNLLLTMLLGGLWHGAAWGFLIWGALHGLLLCAHRFWVGRPEATTRLRWRDLPSVLLCFNAVCVLWVFFRAETVNDAFVVLETILAGRGAPALPVWEMVILLVVGALHLGERLIRTRMAEIRRLLGDGLPGAAIEGFAFGAILALVVATSGSGAEFIYFQF